MIILIMMNFKYLAIYQKVETHFTFITLDYVSVLKMTFSVYGERI